MRLKQIQTALEPLGAPLYHFSAGKARPPYLVWAEDGQGDALWADGRMMEQTATGTVDLYTKCSDDPLYFKVEQALNTGGISWYLNSVQYEDGTGLYHYEWVWEVTYGEDDSQGDG